MKFDRTMKVTKPVESSSDNDFAVPGVDTAEPNEEVIFTAYPCTIKENVKYKAGETGESYEGSAKLYGMLTDKLKVGMLLNNEYKIISKPRLLKTKLVADLIRL